MVVGIIGIVVSALFGMWGVFLALRKKKYPASLAYVFEQSISLVDDFAQKIPNLDVNYKKLPLDKSVALLSGYLVNDGSTDITVDMTERPLVCNLPDDCEFLELDVTTKAKSLKANCEILDKQRAMFNLGLFRRGESFSFQALVLLDDKHASFKKNEQLDDISWTHRIANLGKINTTHLPSHDGKSNRSIWIRRLIGIVGGTSYILMAALMFFAVGPMAPQPEIHYMVDVDGISIEHSFKPEKDGSLTVKNLDSGALEITTLDAYLEQHILRPVVSTKKKSIAAALILYCILIFSGIFMVYISLEKDIKIYRSRKLVSASRSEA